MKGFGRTLTSSIVIVEEHEVEVVELLYVRTLYDKFDAPPNRSKTKWLLLRACFSFRYLFSIIATGVFFIVLALNNSNKSSTFKII